MGFMQATPGDMKSFRSSAERIALMLSGVAGCGGGVATGAIDRDMCKLRNNLIICKKGDSRILCRMEEDKEQKLRKQTTAPPPTRGEAVKLLFPFLALQSLALALSISPHFLFLSNDATPDALGSKHLRLQRWRPLLTCECHPQH